MAQQLAPAPPRIQEITGRENRWLKRFRAALRRDSPDDSGVIAIEGWHLLSEALRSGMSPEAVLLSPAGLERFGSFSALHQFPGTAFLTCSERLFQGICGTETPQGVAALVRLRSYAFEDLWRGPEPLVVVLVAVQDPGNVGTILRTAEAFGATGAIATRGTAHPHSQKALRASAGSALRLPLGCGVQPGMAMAQLRLAGLKLYAASASEGVEPGDADLISPCALFIGNEGAGLPPEVEHSADLRIRIPLSGPVESLNAAVAAAVLLYEAQRQRRARASQEPAEQPDSAAVRRGSKSS